MNDVLVFDVNGTLLDLNVLDVAFVRLFGRASARQEWFGLLQSLADDRSDHPDLPSLRYAG